MKSAVQILATLGLMCQVFASNGGMHSLDLKPGVFNVKWKFNATNMRIYFKVMANTTGWVGFAMTTEEGGAHMKNYDIAIGGVKSGGQKYLNDYWSASQTHPTLDTKQDLVLTNATESGGKTTLEFNRLADTGETTQDVTIKNDSRIFMAWAIGVEDATDANTFNKHGDKLAGGRGHTKVAYNMMTGVELPTTTPPPYSAAEMHAPAVLMISTIIQIAVLAVFH